MVPYIVLIIVCTLAGTCIGTITGLIPGLHVNTVAMLMMAGDTLLFGIIMGLGSVPADQAPLFAAVIITATSITHTFVDFVPSTFLGMPDPDTALSVLPAHELLSRGEGYRAVYLSAIGSALAVGIGALILLPYTWLLGSPLNGYDVLRKHTLYILLLITSFLIVSEKSEVRGSRTLGRIMAFGVFLLSGILGLVVLPLPSTSPVGLFSTVLFPLFSGLFGISTLLLSLIQAKEEGIPEQKVIVPEIGGSEIASAVPGTLAGSLVGFLPGVSSSHAALIAVIRQDNEDAGSEETVIVTLGAVNTANALFVLVALFLTGNPRSGAAVAIMEFVPMQGWSGVLPYHLTILLMSAFLSAFIAYHITLISGAFIAGHINAVPYRRLIMGIILFICVLVLLFNGVLGLCILIVATCTGILPQIIGVRRSHLMGVLLIPVLTYLW